MKIKNRDGLRIYEVVINDGIGLGSMNYIIDGLMRDYDIAVIQYGDWAFDIVQFYDGDNDEYIVYLNGSNYVMQTNGSLHKEYRLNVVNFGSLLRNVYDVINAVGGVI